MLALHFYRCRCKQEDRVQFVNVDEDGTANVDSFLDVLATEKNNLKSLNIAYSRDGHPTS